jgi:CheY-like chemotaxis protein
MAQLPDNIHVLVVDDEQLSRFVVGNLLRNRKCKYAGGYSS